MSNKNKVNRTPITAQNKARRAARMSFQQKTASQRDAQIGVGQSTTHTKNKNCKITCQSPSLFDVFLNNKFVKQVNSFVSAKKFFKKFYGWGEWV